MLLIYRVYLFFLTRFLNVGLLFGYILKSGVYLFIFIDIVEDHTNVI